MGLVARFETRGKKYRIDVEHDLQFLGYFRIFEYTNSRQTGSASGLDYDRLIVWLRSSIRGAKIIDGINYRQTYGDKISL